MDELKTLVWILLAIGAFVYRMVKKVQENSARESRERPTRPAGSVVPGLPTASFQELLQQMQARNAPVPAAPAPQKAPVAPLAPAARTLGGRLMPREIARPTFSKERVAVRQASLEAPATARSRGFTPSVVVRRASEQPRAYTEALPEFNRQGAATGSAAPLNETVRQMLRQPEGVRAAFVLSEIFQRKY
ncbi:hypothetical protein BEN47_13195 [Hymenobacter lapidarius]|uniref:Uncharacterized protein n=1 Tax=Hymenobacter lapidarius TaxID=1908237 RepID=A0A1G1T6D8_9BACT|nr:hypothetical protein [Hymenobacter lapidarius]OGX86451.1 hypothetical protein BEN47_13195 [Hymenobacter lapidarius]